MGGLTEELTAETWGLSRSRSGLDDSSRGNSGAGGQGLPGTCAVVPPAPRTLCPSARSVWETGLWGRPPLGLLPPAASSLSQREDAVADRSGEGSEVGCLSPHAR